VDVVIDTDILSTFCKIGKLELLARLFHKSTIIVCPAVHKEITRAESGGRLHYLPPPSFSRVTLTHAEQKMARGIWDKKRLGRGDCECIAVAQQRKCVLLTNDRRAQRAAGSLSISYMSLQLVLRELYVTGISSRIQIRELINQIETKDNVQFKDPNSLLD
jgi:predicted nucleic acid-binding protein